MEQQSAQQRAYSPLPQPSGRLIQDPEITLPSIAGPLAWRLFYFSDLAANSGEWGYGRRASWPIRLCAETNGLATMVYLEREDGNGVQYLAANTTLYSPVSPRTFDQLTNNPDGTWDETRFDTRATFQNSGRRLTSRVEKTAPPLPPLTAARLIVILHVDKNRSFNNIALPHSLQ